MFLDDLKNKNKLNRIDKYKLNIKLASMLLDNNKINELKIDKSVIKFSCYNSLTKYDEYLEIDFLLSKSIIRLSRKGKEMKLGTIKEFINSPQKIIHIIDNYINAIWIMK